MDGPLVGVAERESLLGDRGRHIVGRPLVAEVDLVATDREVVAAEDVAAAVHFEIEVAVDVDRLGEIRDLVAVRGVLEAAVVVAAHVVAPEHHGRFEADRDVLVCLHDGTLRLEADQGAVVVVEQRKVFRCILEPVVQRRVTHDEVVGSSA